MKAFLLITFFSTAIARADQNLPNVVLIYADDLGYGDLSCYNKNSKIPTKHLDGLAAEGMRFTDGHSSSGICTPSRYALLTGRHHWRDFHGIVGVMGSSVFKPERLTLPEMMQQQGYTTGAIGKWHLGWDWDAIKTGLMEGSQVGQYDWSKPIPDGPLAHGFDYYFGDSVINFPPFAWIENDKLIEAPTEMMDTSKWKELKEGRWECRDGAMVKGWDPYQNIPKTTEKGVEFIKEKALSDQPYFLYFAYPSPHAPIIPNDVFDGTSKAGPYGDFIVETDASVGKLLKAIEDSGEADNTIVIFSADNGPEKYAYARDEKYAHWSSHPLKGLKRDVYEGGHRVPFIIKYPGVTKPNTVSDALVSQIDYMATLAEVIGFNLPDKLAAEDSYSILPTLIDPGVAVRETHVHNTKVDSYGIRHGDWVLLVKGSGYVSRSDHKWEKKYGYAKSSRKKDELYNLKDDLAQKHNVAEAFPEKVKELKVLLANIRKQGYSAPRLAPCKH